MLLIAATIQRQRLKKPNPLSYQGDKAGAERYERTEERITSRNGARPSYWKTRVGKIELQIPKLRQGAEQIVHLAGTDAVNVCLLDDRQ